ncbi:sigma factor [Nocardioides panacisoli]|uniref:Sigma-70 family RNA polymerase sigma factor SigK n=1 Tax=Nocardioides panacisoli TaxID=627624 RepID=A0ABP7J6K6_9ACTN
MVRGASRDRPESSDDDVVSGHLSRSARGDKGGLADLYDETSERVLGLVLQVVRDRALAEEITRDVYLEVWRTAVRYDGSTGSGMSWLMMTAHRRAVDRLRATERGRDDRCADLATDPSDAAGGADVAAVQRRVVDLAYFGGCTDAEIAQATGVSLSTARAWIRDGLVGLRDRG